MLELFKTGHEIKVDEERENFLKTKIATVSYSGKLFNNPLFFFFFCLSDSLIIYNIIYQSFELVVVTGIRSGTKYPHRLFLLIELIHFNGTIEFLSSELCATH